MVFEISEHLSNLNDQNMANLSEQVTFLFALGGRNPPPWAIFASITAVICHHQTVSGVVPPVKPQMCSKASVTFKYAISSQVARCVEYDVQIWDYGFMGIFFLLI